MDPNFSFQSSTHFSDMFGAFEEFYSSNAMSDVMVSVSGKTFNAHRIVLSAGSDYFRNILTGFKDSVHVPVLVINEISPEDIESMIEFLYRGQIVVTRDRVENLRRAASHLRIKGFENFLRKPFSGNKNASSGNMSADNHKSLKGYNTPSTSLLSRESLQHQFHGNQLNKRSSNGNEIESKRKRTSKQQLQRPAETDAQENYTYEMDPTALSLGCWANSDNGHEVKASRTAEGGSDFDEEDGYDNESIANRENHAKLAMMLNHFNLANLMMQSGLNGNGIGSSNGQFFYCEHCPKYYFDEDKLQLHVKRAHGVNKLNICNICGKTYAWKSGLYKHKRHVHNISGKTLNQVNENVMAMASGSDNQSISSSTEATSPPMTPTDLVSMMSMFASTGEAALGEASSSSPQSIVPAGFPQPQQQHIGINRIAEQQPLALQAN